MIDYNDTEMQEVYLEQIKENYQNPQNQGKIKDYTFLSHYKNPSCGDTFDMYVKLDSENDKIIDVKYFGQGCAISTASMSLFSEKLIGMKFSDAKKLENNDIYELLGIKISPTRINCAMISLMTFKKGSTEFEKQK